MGAAANYRRSTNGVGPKNYLQGSDLTKGNGGWNPTTTNMSFVIGTGLVYGPNADVRVDYMYQTLPGGTFPANNLEGRIIVTGTGTFHILVAGENSIPDTDFTLNNNTQEFAMPLDNATHTLYLVLYGSPGSVLTHVELYLK